MADVLCPTCGRPNAGTREFCDFCGNPLDGALAAESGESLLRDDLFPEGEPVDAGSGGDPADEASRLDSFFSEPEESVIPDSTSPEDDSSRLDDYLPVDDQPEPPGRGIPSEPAEDPFRLEDFFSDESPELPASETTPGEQAGDELTRLDDYLLGEEEPLPSPESGQGQGSADADRLDDYLSREISPPASAEELPAEDSQEQDGFLSLDPFGDADPFAAGEPDQAAEDRGQAEGGLAAFGPAASERDLPGDLERLLNEPEGGEEPEDPWDFFADEPEQSAAAGDAPPAPTREEDPWDLQPLETEDTPGSRESDEAPIGETSPGEWDFLAAESSDPEPDQDEIQPKEPPLAQAGGSVWDFLDPDRAQEQPDQAPEPTAEASPAGWDFLDPSPSADSADEEHASPGMPSSGEFDWLDPGPAADYPDEDEQPEFDSEGFGEDSGWLDMLQTPESRDAAPPEKRQPPKPQTDWLDKIKRLNKSSDLVDEDSSFPDWLAVSEKPAAEPEEPPQEEPAESSDQVPDWLGLDGDESINEFLRKKDLTNEEYVPPSAEPAPPAAESDAEAPAADLSDSQQIKFPSWAESEKKKGQKPKDLQFMAEYEDGPGGRKSAEPFQLGEEYFDDLFDDELPAWLTSAYSREITQPFEEELTQGELPGWVEAMRPVVESTDASGLGEDEDYIENYGPLAGIPSVLPAEAEIGINLEEEAKKPLDLLSSKSNQDFVNLLKKIIADENKGKSILRPAAPQTQRVLRWLISIILLVATALTIIFGGGIETQPPSGAQIQGSAFAALYNEIGEIYESQPILIAYDYQPAAAGELHTAAAGVVDHLMEQGAYLTFVSTQPTGPALAEQFLATTQAEHGYIHTQKYINLGYLPGESAGLLSFMIAPKQIIPLAFDGSNAWDSPPLLGVNSMEDFRMILVITDDPNIAKIWIEQVGSQLQGTPLAMVVSAQVEPLIQPYFRSSPQQLSGYVAGLIGSMNYEQLSQRPNLASKLWLPFNMSIIISVGVIFISGLANGVLSIFSRRRIKPPGESQ